MNLISSIITLYFKVPVARLRPKYETLMDTFSDKIQYLTHN